MGNALDLFKNDQLLDWLPDETLFSLASRHHYFWGHGTAKRTNVLLFGHPQGGSQHDFPSCIDEFVARTERRLGNAEQICTQRTLLRYYRKFIDESIETDTIATLRGSSVANLKFRLGILTSRFRANHPLKACMSCIAHDRATHGWAYWHVQHQYPGVWICLAHGLPLYESNLKSTGVERFLWHLPNEAHLRPCALEINASRHALTSMHRLAKLTTTLVDDAPKTRIDLTQLHWLYRDELGQRNLLTSSGSLRLSEIANEFVAHVKPLKLCPELKSLPSDVDDAYAQLSRILRAPRSGTHPLRHLILIEWLFPEGTTFVDKYSKTISAFQSPNFNQALKADTTHISTADQIDRKQELSRLIQSGGLSMRAAALMLGIDTATAIVWAAQMGIDSPRRPKKLKSDLRRALVAQLTQGIDKEVAAKQFEISVVTVTHVLRSEPGLSRQWHLQRHQIAQIKAREAWSALIAQHESLGVKFIRNINPSVYAWLYRNDRAWLSERSPRQKLNLKSVGQSVKWDERDVILSTAVERAALSLRVKLGKKKLMLWHLYQEIPELKAKLGALNRLPTTVRAIERALNRHSPSKPQTDMLD